MMEDVEKGRESSSPGIRRKKEDMNNLDGNETETELLSIYQMVYQN